MKNKAIVTTSREFIPELEDEMKKRENELKELARRNARHFAKRNLPSPKGDVLVHYIGDLKTGHEKIAADFSQRLQPTAHFPEAKIDHDHFKEKESHFTSEITKRENENHHDEYDLGNFNPASIFSRIRGVVIANIIIVVGEILFNTKSFQVTGENMLFSLILSVSISFAVAVFSHMATFLYKAAKTAFQRRLVLFLTFFLIIGIFTALAVFRSRYLEGHDVNINPFYFVIINLFFFIVTALLSFFILPTWEEIKQNEKQLKIYRTIFNRRKEIENLKNEKNQLKEEHAEKTKQRVRTVHYANYSLDTIRKMYYDTVEIFKSTNLAFRTDGKTPDCFSEKLIEPNIEDVVFNMPSKLNSK